MRWPCLFVAVVIDDSTHRFIMRWPCLFVVVVVDDYSLILNAVAMFICWCYCCCCCYWLLTDVECGGHVLLVGGGVVQLQSVVDEHEAALGSQRLGGPLLQPDTHTCVPRGGGHGPGEHHPDHPRGQHFPQPPCYPTPPLLPSLPWLSLPDHTLTSHSLLKAMGTHCFPLAWSAISSTDWLIRAQAGKRFDQTVPGSTAVGSLCAKRQLQQTSRHCAGIQENKKKDLYVRSFE